MCPNYMYCAENILAQRHKAPKNLKTKGRGHPQGGEKNSVGVIAMLGMMEWILKDIVAEC